MPKPNEKVQPQTKNFSDAAISQRQDLYDKAQKHNNEAAPPNKPADFQPAPPADTLRKPDAPLENKGQEPEPAKPPVEPQKPGVSPEVKDEKKEVKEQKTVPLEALHEAREDVKSLKRDNAELQDQVKTLLKDLRELSTKPKGDEPGTEEAVISDYDKELLDLRKEVKQLREKDQTRDKMTESEQLRQRQEALKGQLQETGRDLEKDGFLGFSDFLPMISAELQRIAVSDPKEAQALDNPDGWKKIFKEVIHPKVTGLGQKKSLEDKTKEKENLKEGANLLLPGGQPAPQPAKKDDDYSYAQYMRERANRSAQPQRRI